MKAKTGKLPTACAVLVALAVWIQFTTGSMAQMASHGTDSQIMTQASADAKPNSTTLYVVTRSTQKFRIGGRDNPSVGLFTTTDRGKNWQHWGWHYTKCFSVALAPPVNGETLYLACGNGVMKSSDGGRQWQIASGWQITECLQVAVDPQNPDIVYAATAYGIYRSDDSGMSWSAKNEGFASTFTSSILIDSGNPARLYVATEAGVYTSDDRGDHWLQTGLAGKGVRMIEQSPHEAAVFWAGTEDDGVFRSNDGGKEWRAMNAGLTHKTIYALACDPLQDDVLYAGTFKGGVFKSEDTGRSWKPANEGLKILDIHALVVDPAASNLVYCGTLGDGVYSSENGGDNWRFIGLETSQVWDFVIRK